MHDVVIRAPDALGSLRSFFAVGAGTGGTWSDREMKEREGWEESGQGRSHGSSRRSYTTGTKGSWLVTSYRRPKACGGEQEEPLLLVA